MAALYNARENSAGALIAAAFAMLLGLAVMVAWHTGNADLAQLGSGFVPMVYNTALGFFLGGFSLFFLVLKNNLAARVLGALTVALALFVFFQYLFGYDSFIDEFFIKSYVTTGMTHLGRMAPNTAVCFILIGGVLIAKTIPKLEQRYWWIGEFFTLLVLALAVAAFLAYFLGQGETFGWANQTRMALLTAIGFLGLSTGCLMYVWGGRAEKVATVPIWIPSLLLFAVLGFDISQPLTVAAGIAYVPLVFCSLWFIDRYAPLLFAGIATILFGLGVVMSPDLSAITLPTLINVGLSILAIWITALVAFLLKNVQASLQSREIEMADQRDFLETVEDTIENGLAVFDPNGKILHVNRATAAIFGYSEDTLLGMNINKLIHRNDPSGPGTNRKVRNLAFNQPGDGHAEVKGFRADESEISLEIAVNQTDSKGQTVFVMSITDTTEKRKVEQQYRQAQKLEAVGQLTGGVAHDFNNLLTAVIGGLKLLENEKLSKSAKDCVELALSSALRGAELTKRLLTFSRRQALESKVYEANEVLSGMETLIQRSIGPEVKVAIHTASEDLPIYVDKSEFENVLLNMAINSRDAMPSGGDLTIEIGRVKVGPDRAEREKMKPGEYVVTTVSDTGLGMSDEVKKKAIEPFFTTKGVGKGTGLGLSQVFGFVKQSGGYLTIYSELGHGTSIKIYLPLAKQSEEKDVVGEKAVELLKDPETRAHLKGKKILLVDDDPGVRMFAEKVLASSGYRLTTAEDGASALDAIKNGRDFDLLIADMVMPDEITGLDIASAFSIKFPGSGILFCSGYPEKILRGNGRLAVTGEVLPKPYDLTALLTKVEQLLVMSEIDQKRHAGNGGRKATS